MADRPTKTITTPVQGNVVVLKEWITGAEREHINEPNLSSIKATPKVAGKFSTIDIGSIDINKMVTEGEHRAFEAFVVSVDGQTDDILNRVLSLHEHDTAFVSEQIAELSKKKEQE